MQWLLPDSHRIVRSRDTKVAGVSSPVVRRSPTHRAQVIDARQLTPRMRRVTVQADSMIDMAIRPAQDVELFLREGTGRRVKRRYTIRHARPERGELDLDVLLHGTGPGSAWGETATAGDTVEFQGPRGKLELTPADWHLLAGDESALPAIAAVCEALPPTEHAIAVIEVGDASDELPLPAATDTRWVHRAGAPPGSPELLTAAIDALPTPAGTGHGYLMGETRSMVALRALLEARGLAHEAIFVKGYWNVARPDRISGRSPAGR
jgi:NADPH-dependent ferric siderophore reductase